MFTVKFIRDNVPPGIAENESLTTTTVSISCPHYEVLDRHNGQYTIITFKDHFDTTGVERHVAVDHFDYCYVENISGKTIARYSHLPEGVEKQYCA